MLNLVNKSNEQKAIWKVSHFVIGFSVYSK